MKEISEWTVGQKSNEHKLQGNERTSWKKIFVLIVGGLRMVVCIEKQIDVKESHGEILSKLKSDITLSNYWYNRYNM